MFVVEMTLGDVAFRLEHITVQEMVKVKSWTSYKNRDEWFEALRAEDPEALIAAYCLVKQRDGQTIRFAEVDFDLDDLDAKFVDGDGREVEPTFETNEDGSVKTDKDGKPVPVLKNGSVVWVFSDTKEEVPPTKAV